MPFDMPAERDTTRPPLKPFLLLALTLSVLAFCTILLSR
jgi:hypothetical protein